HLRELGRMADRSIAQMTQQDDITQRVLTGDEINTAIDWPAANTTMRAENDRAMAREVEAAVLRKLSKLRAPVADERAAQEYGSPADVAQRIEQYLAQDGRMNSGTQLLYEAMKALRASQGDRNDG
ncbi:hypothetical protein NAT65_16185, partial [Achromobacter xylosoxidans]|uniref:hypothetical protein n=1 Tax=Alcaligenes xylosoxydans xylosoxydans TaxID=85698 RepID=UPI002041BECE